MADSATTETTDTTTESDAAGESSTDSANTDASTESATDAGEEALGDAGKKALDAMKAKWKSAENDLKAIRSEFDAFKAQAEGTQAEHEAKLAEQRIKDEALAAANERILKAEFRAAAKGKLSDPSDAFRFPDIIDLSSFEVGSDGSVDAVSLEAAIDLLIEKKPYLGAQGTTRFQGSADGGARNGSRPASVDEQIAEAEKSGDRKTASRLKAQRLIDIQRNQPTTS